MKNEKPLDFAINCLQLSTDFFLCVDMSHIVVCNSHEMNRECENNYIFAGKIKPLGRRRLYEKDFCGALHGGVPGGV